MKYHFFLIYCTKSYANSRRKYLAISSTAWWTERLVRSSRAASQTASHTVGGCSVVCSAGRAPIRGAVMSQSSLESIRGLPSEFALPMAERTAPVTAVQLRQVGTTTSLVGAHN